MTKKRIFMALLAALLLLPASLRAQEELTVAQQTAGDSNYYVPVCGSYTDYGFWSEFIYPEDMLEEMVGGTISQLAFTSDNAHTNLSWANSTFSVYMSHTDVDAYTASSSGSWVGTDMELVFTGNMSVVNHVMTVVLDEPFVYEGGNLCVRVTNGGGAQWATCYFRGVVTTGMQSAYRTSTGSTPQTTYASATNFLPQCTITYTAGGGTICRKPVSLAVSDIAADGATLSWSPRGEETQWVVYADGQEVEVVSDSTYTFTGLSSSSAHSVSVRALCGVGDTSAYSSASFTTLCVAISASDLPWQEGFENMAANSLSTCWDRYRYTTEDYGYGSPYVSTSTASGPYVVGSNAHGGNNALRLSATNSYDNDDYDDYEIETYDYSAVFMPEFEGGISGNTLTFWYKVPSNFNRVSLGVGVSDSVADTATFTRLLTIEPADADWHEYDIDLSVYTGAGNRIAFVQTPRGSQFYGYDYVYGYLDDIVVEATSDCVRPASVSISGLTATGATVSWVDAGTVGTYQVTLNGDTDNAQTVNGDTAVTLSLEPNTLYVVGVSKLCDGAYTAERTYTFRTPCTAVSHDDLPWTENFDNVNQVGASLDNPLQVPCLTFGYYTSTYSSYPYANASTHYGASGNALYFYREASTPREYVALPMFEDNLADLMVSFQMYCGSSNYKVEVGVMADPNNASTFVPFDTIGVAAGSTWEYKEVTFGGYTGEGGYIALGPLMGSNSNVSIDNLSVSMAANCARVQGVQVSNITESSADVTIVDSTAVGHYRLTYYALGTDTTVVELTDGTMTTTLSGLAAPKGYTLLASSVCDDGNVTTPVSIVFRTITSPVTELPYSCGFEADQDSLWDLVNGVYNGWYTGSAVNNGGTGALYISNDNGVSNAYTTSSATAASMAVRSFVLQPGEYTVSFDWRAYGESTYDYLRAVVVPEGYFFEGGVRPAGLTASTVPTGWTDLCGKLNTKSSWQSVDTTFMVDTAGTYTLAFIWINDGGGGTQPPAAVDNVQLGSMSCPRPTNLVADGVSSDAFNISWHAMGEETSWTVGIDGVETIVTDTTHSFTGLDAATAYHVTVRAICGEGDTSASIALNVQTTQVAYTDGMPYSTGFESGDDTQWLLVNGTNAWTIGSAVNNGGTSALYISNDNGVSNAYSTSSSTMSYAVRTIQFDQAGDYAVSFDWRAYGEGSYDFIRAWIAPATATFTANQLPSGATSTYSYTTATPAGWIDIAGGKLNMQNAWQNMTNTFNLPAAGAYSVVFMWANDASSGSQPAAAIDNLIISQLSCPTPTALTLDNAGLNSLTFHWTAGGSESQWEVTVGDAAPVVVSSATYTANGLNSSTAYAVKVRAICGEGDSSFFASETFRTDCGSVSLPYTEDFEGMTASAAPECWNIIVPYTAYSTTYPYVYNSSYGAHGGSKYISGHMGSSAEQLWFTTPTIAASANNLNVTFWAQFYQEGYDYDYDDYDYYDARLQVGVMTNANDTSTFTVVFDTTGTIDSWQQFSFTTSALSVTGNAVVAFRMLQAYATYNDESYLRIDDLSITAVGDEPGPQPQPECEAPTVTNATATESSVTLTWTSTASNFEVAIVEGAWSEPATTVSATGTQYTFSGLNANTQYTAGVRTVCANGQKSAWSTRGVTTATQGIDDASLSNFSVYPNPASTVVTVVVGTDASVSLLDVSGRPCGEWKVENGMLGIDISQLARGTYFVRVSTADATAVRKLIVK